MLGVPSSGTRGPDLAKSPGAFSPVVSAWMHDPQRIQAGTRMPTVFLNGESPYKDILAGDRGRQREAIWSYLALAKSLPPPEGLEEKKLQTLTADDRLVVIRTFLPAPRHAVWRIATRTKFTRHSTRRWPGWRSPGAVNSWIWGRCGMAAAVTSAHLGKDFLDCAAGMPLGFPAGRRVATELCGCATIIQCGETLCVTASCIRRRSARGLQSRQRGTDAALSHALDAGESAAFSGRVMNVHTKSAVAPRESRIAAPATNNYGFSPANLRPAAIACRSRLEGLADGRRAAAAGSASASSRTAIRFCSICGYHDRRHVGGATIGRALAPAAEARAARSSGADGNAERAAHQGRSARGLAMLVVEEVK